MNAKQRREARLSRRRERDRRNRALEREARLSCRRERESERRASETG